MLVLFNCLQYQEVKVLLSMKSSLHFVVDDKKLLVNYVYLDTDEEEDLLK